MSLGEFTEPDAAAQQFAARLTHETDVSDVREAQRAKAEFVLVDVRNDASWRAGRIPGAIHMHHSEIVHRAPSELSINIPVIVYCWGPGCNGSTRGALEFARLGFRVKEMIGGYEYWVREGFSTVTDAGLVSHAIDPLTAPAH